MNTHQQAAMHIVDKETPDSKATVKNTENNVRADISNKIQLLVITLIVATVTAALDLVTPGTISHIEETQADIIRSCHESNITNSEVMSLIIRYQLANDRFLRSQILPEVKYPRELEEIAADLRRLR